MSLLGSLERSHTQIVGRALAMQGVLPEQGAHVFRRQNAGLAVVDDVVFAIEDGRIADGSLEVVGFLAADEILGKIAVAVGEALEAVVCR